MRRFLPAACVWLAWPAWAQSDAEFFEARVRPVLARSCYGCHGPDQQLSNLRVDSRSALLAGGKRGPAIAPGQPDASLLLQAVRHERLQMPPGGKLKESEVAALSGWILRGAVWPEQAARAPSTDERFRKLAREHWAFQPVRKPGLPPVTRPESHPVDRFVTASLEKAGLHRAPPAGARALLRRVSYVLTGLPPSAGAVDRFMADPSPEAYARAVDDLLASPAFGAHWARHWMDLVRYAETRGYEWNYEIPGAWRYRDYLIRAFNADLPYDELVREHIAGDLLPKPRINAAEQINESVIGTAFYRLGEAGHDDCVMFREIALDVMDNQIDTLTKTFQGLTVSCARCHDHKLDPVTTEDYYGLYSILNSSRQVTHTIDTADVNAARIGKLLAIKTQIRAELAANWMKEAAAGVTPARLESWRKLLRNDGEKLEDPLSVWAAIACETGGNAAFFRSTAARIAERYRAEAASRAAFNRENFTGWFDTREWSIAGMGLREGVSRDGDFSVAESGDAAVSGVFPAGIYTHLVSSRLNGALRSPDAPKQRKRLSVRALGGQLSACRTVIDNCAIGEKNKFVESSRLQWVKLDTVAEEKQLPVFFELVTRWDNPRIPDRPGVLKPAQLKWMDTPRSYFGVAGAVLHDIDETPREELSHMLPLLAAGPPQSPEDLAARYAAVIRQAVERWAAGHATAGDVRWLDWLVHNKLFTNSANATARLGELVAEYRAVEATLAEPRTVDGLADMAPGRDFPILVGGDAKHAGPPAPRRYLRLLFGESAASRGSGRRELAGVIADPSNPLTARVMVNRLWRRVFGRGLVPSVDNFGLAGDRPSHPELLDYLAATFVEQGWSVKKMLRLMVTSQTFRQGGEIPARAREVDPDNAMLHHYPLRRLEAEPLRDSILMASGNLNGAMFGPSTHPYRKQPKEYRRLFSGPLNGDGRRSLYLKVTRMEGAGFLETFDHPVPMTTRGARDVTNVPAQALAMMNDPFVIAEAEACARRLVETPAGDANERIRTLFRMTLGRNPAAAEAERLQGLAAELASLHHVPRDRALSSVEVWKDMAHAIFNLKEFLYFE